MVSFIITSRELLEQDTYSEYNITACYQVGAPNTMSSSYKSQRCFELIKKISHPKSWNFLGQTYHGVSN